MGSQGATNWVSQPNDSCGKWPFDRPMIYKWAIFRKYFSLLEGDQLSFAGIYKTNNVRRKFRSQTSENMDRWKSRGGKSQRKEEKKKEDQRRERVRGKKMQVLEKVEKSRFAIFFQWFVAPEGRKVGLLKWRVRSHLAIWEMKNCRPLWREARFQVKMHKTHQLGPLLEVDVEKVHAVVARSTFGSQKCSKLTGSEHFWKLRCWKSAHRCGAKHMSKSKCTKHFSLGAHLEVQMSKKCTTPWHEAHFEVRMLKTHKNATCSDHFGRFRCGFARHAPGILHPAKNE